ncbi:hypothetical protein ALQ04_01825 [Pseudomonas cichorii]|uniref:Lipoprotein n=1 Tax=Pseudomonas cichorii TaxID=36746 RepID=A0A3M4MBD3_PSECI|nr:hypothetical protein [Pseudomonas cichorii]RMQ50849.1 hypothetical protein ALQ04_01825 [Pseudomonas cichorii]
MIGNRMAALSIATLMACTSMGAWAGSTGPTHPQGHEPANPAMQMKKDQEKNTDGSSPETRGRVPDPSTTNGMGSGPTMPQGSNNGDNDSTTPNDEKPSGH